MQRRPLPLEACLDLKIHLDNLRSSEERCLEGLQRLVAGDLTRDDHLGLLDRQVLAQRAWDRRHRKYFKDPGSAWIRGRKAGRFRPVSGSSRGGGTGRSR